MASNSAHDEPTPVGERADEPTLAQGGQSPEEQLEEARRQVDDLTDKYKRSVAEFANYRKRQERERNQQRERVTMDVLGRLLPLMDDLDLALENVPGGIVQASEEAVAWLEGITLIRHKLDSVLDSYGVTPIAAAGKPFDPLFHAALIQAPSEDYPAGIVMAELQKGYIMGGQVLRPTRVAVSSGASSET